MVPAGNKAKHLLSAQPYHKKNHRRHFFTRGSEHMGTSTLAGKCIKNTNELASIEQIDKIISSRCFWLGIYCLPFIKNTTSFDEKI